MEFSEAWETNRISEKLPSNVRHADLKLYLEKLRQLGVAVDGVGESFGGREIFRISWGKGPLKVLMWSQMHGDEPTATSALVDMFAFLQKNRDKREWVAALERSVTIWAVPMLNPDGAEVFHRYNFQGIDINRDAQSLRTPEGRLLKKLRDELKPDIGFNLHNQQELTTVGDSFRQAAISLLAVSGKEEKKSTYPGHERNKRLCAVIIGALSQFIDGHLARYDDSYNPLAFGDMVSAWGSPVILVETGGLHGRDEMFLVKMNFIAYLSALQALVDGSELLADAAVYDRLPFNGNGRLMNVIFRRANIIRTGETVEVFTADIGVNRSRRRDQFPPPFYIREVGDLSRRKGLEEYDVSDYFVIARDGELRPGMLSQLLFYKRSRKIDWSSPDLESSFPPDAVYFVGEWEKPLER